jgi:hypothetical protein
MRGLYDNKIAYKHTGRPLAHRHDPQTRPRAAPPSQLHRQCAAKLPHYHCLHSGGARRQYSAHYLRTPRGGKEFHRACSAVAPQVSLQWVPLFLDRPSHEGFLALAGMGGK